MTLTDTGPLVALIDVDDQHHAICETALEAALVTFPLLTTWSCLAEAMHLLWRGGGYGYQATLWSMYLRGEVVLHQHMDAKTVRMAELMEQYRDTPMDLADASLAAAAESLALRRVFTVDRHFTFTDWRMESRRR